MTNDTEIEKKNQTRNEKNIELFQKRITRQCK